ncbi:MAG: hypothetical protein PVJ77_21260, partial [Desulfobacterales bacterium]
THLYRHCCRITETNSETILIAKLLIHAKKKESIIDIGLGYIYKPFKSRQYTKSGARFRHPLSKKFKWLQLLN